MKQRRLKINQNRKITHRNIVNVELDIKCSCTQSTSNNNAIIQFTRRYLQCYSLMPIRIIRLLIETILPLSPIIKISIFDLNDRLLKDSDRLYSLKHSSSSSYILLRFILFNTITSLPHCSCLSPSLDNHLSSSSLPTIIQQETIDKILSNYSIPQSPSFNSMNIYQPIIRSSFLIDCESEPDESTMDNITSEFGEICSPLPKYISQEIFLDYPLDLSMKSKQPNGFKSNILSNNVCDAISLY